ncbi:FecR family protein [Pseudomonas schmalbachii]|uniref:FecR family protein n=1 Tax=Pseudomonas schmalbachii TaxID=2816993 RepID=A0ABS3TKX1_9PSED|nr:FecR family protein [Pseudomonas schmalbachii]MBO3274300.1 FecR family protein [Pseudomonas schmalbachii]
MTIPAEDQERATAEAARWLIALEEDPDDAALQARFEAWLDASPANALAWADTADVYQMMGQLQPRHAEHWAPREAATAAPAPASLSPRTPRRTAWRRRLALGAMAACLALAAMPSLLLRMEADHLTATAEQRTLRLEDGSQVRLGADSAIAVAFVQGERRVQLLRGEAFFEVAADAARPFRVQAGEVRTTVLGTAFEVRRDGDSVAVAVDHGRVLVEQPGAPAPLPARLGKGDWLRLGRDGAVEHGSMPADQVAAWRQGQIVVRDRPLGEVVEELRRYHQGLIILADDAFAGQRVTGVYNLADPAAALRILAGAHGGKVRQVSPWLLVISAG